jgi:hypothetical protein
MAADLLTTIRSEIDFRMSRLRPAVEEYEDLRSVLDAMDTGSAPGTSSALTQATCAPESLDGALDTAVAPAAMAPERNRAIPAPVRRPRPVRPRARTVRRTAPARRTAPVPRTAPAIDAASQAILAALEHGSHTVAELGIVTALPAGQIRERAGRLRSSGGIVTTEREGRTAYALPAHVE